MKTKIILIGFMITITVSVSAQTQNSQVAAFAQSYQYEYIKNYPKSIEMLTGIYDANSYDINLRIGWLYYESGDYTSSVTYYKKAIQASPKSVEARLGIAYPMAAMGNWDDLAAIYLEVITIDPANSLVNYRLGEIYYNKKDYDKALMYALKVRDTWGFDYDTNLLLGQIYIGLNKITEAKEVLNDALLYFPDSSDVKDLLKKIL
jgi:tetratricopeptide (TPR) repeat protein